MLGQDDDWILGDSTNNRDAAQPMVAVREVSRKMV